MSYFFEDLYYFLEQIMYMVVKARLDHGIKLCWNNNEIVLKHDNQTQFHRQLMVIIASQWSDHALSP